MRQRLGWVLTITTAFILVAALGLLCWSWVSQSSTWESGVLVQFGSTLLLFVPLVIVGHGIERSIDSVRRHQDQISTRQEKTASDVAHLAEDVAQTQADLRLTREQLTEVPGLPIAISATAAEHVLALPPLADRRKRNSFRSYLSEVHTRDQCGYP